MNHFTPQELIHKNERKYFIIVLLFSLITYIGLFMSVVGIIYVGLFIGISLFLHGLSLGFIRTNGVRLKPEQFPIVYEKVKELCEKMEMSYIPDVYVMESGGALNAFATRFFGRNMIVLYSTIFELIEREGEDELAFVIAHELAHIKRRHISKQLIILPAMWIPGLTQSYSRACEFTCDRYATYYTGNSEAAKNCLTMLGIGSALYKKVNRSNYLDQIEEEKGFFIWLSEILSTHPTLPKRINQIEYFLGESEINLGTNNQPQKLWLWVPVSLLLFAALIGGSVYLLNKFEESFLFSETSMNLDLETTPLIHAVVEADIEQVYALLEEGVDPDEQDMDGWTALHWAVKDVNTDVTKAILDSGADPNLMDYYGETPLMKAAWDGRAEMVTLLLEAGGTINEQDYNGWTPLIYAVQSGDIETIQILLNAGANQDIKDHGHLTALMHAIQQGNDKVVNLLRSQNKS
ncbi:M48 family metallopeptidase [Anaerobacillus sp. MEB173]|uniref:M48 family metallopeptidase n=1 Tax=Anaerobacillus sp. MEB173 TaxID=3383345 RepID=UPI003F91AE80